MKKRYQARLFHSAYLPEQLYEMRGPVVLFIGRSNSGKSSLLNTLTGTREAMISKQPGKTRSVNYYHYGPRLVLVDLPGYGYAKRSHSEKVQWAELMKAFFDDLPAGGLAFILLEAKRDPEDEEFQLLDALGRNSHRVEFLLTKSDRLNQSLRRHRLKALQKTMTGAGGEKALTWRFVSVKTGEEIDALRRDLHEYEKKFTTQAAENDPERS